MKVQDRGELGLRVIARMYLCVLTGQSYSLENNFYVRAVDVAENNFLDGTVGPMALQPIKFSVLLCVKIECV